MNCTAKYPSIKKIRTSTERCVRNRCQLRYRMTHNTYGVTSAELHAIRPILQLVEATKHPAASFALKFDMYVDDLLIGASSQMEAKLLQDVLIEHLPSAGFQLRKWFLSAFICRSPSRKLSGDSRHQGHRSRRILHQNT